MGETGDELPLRHQSRMEEEEKKKRRLGGKVKDCRRKDHRK